MTMDQKSKKDLAFSSVLEVIKQQSLSSEGSLLLEELSFCTEVGQLENRQEIIAEFLRLLSSGATKEPSRFPDLSGVLGNIRDIRYSLDGLALYQVAVYIESAQGLMDFCQSTLSDKVPLAHVRFLLGPSLEPELISLKEEIMDTLLEDGTVRPTHPVIASLLQQVEKARQGRMKFAKEFIQSHRNQAQSEQGAYRDGRLVIPLRNDRRGSDDGFISGSSASGNTIFAEPFRLVELNNDVVLAQNQILIETARIIKALNDRTKALMDLLLGLSKKVAMADCYYALAKYSHLTNAIRTDLNLQRCHLLGARHPLLGSKAVPITISLDAKVRAVVLSGPNAGGKTVTIKTVGLLSLLNQFCGFIPAKEGSALPLFDNIFTEIGDEQSIDQGLSTFSGHMKQTAYILTHMTSRSLVILDELGSGTDPVEGSALARSILEECIRKSALTLVTSHHGVLKQFAYARVDVLNASMAFDDKSHTPTFTVIQGLPGDSHALDTARAMQVPSQVVDQAQRYLGSSAVQIGEIIKGLEEKRQQALAKEQELKEKEEELQEQLGQVQLRELKVKQSSLLLKDEQSTELAHFMREKNRELEKLVADLRSGEVTREKTVKVRQYVSSLKKKKLETDAFIENEQERLAQQDTKEPFREGEDVLCGKAMREGVVIKVLDKGKYLVALGSMRMTLGNEDLSRPQRVVKKVKVLYSSDAPAPKIVMDVRGLTLEEALGQLDLQIESALVHGLSTFSVIHGYGDGILSRGIGEYLKQHPSVKDYRFALPEDGGMGKTYVML